MANPYEVNGLKFFVKNGLATCLTPVMMDIETSNNHAENVQDLRTWMVSCQIWFNNDYYLFRKPEEVVDFFDKMYTKYKLYPSEELDKRLIIYIHNASYDLSYLVPYFEEGLPVFPYEGQGIITKENQFITYKCGSLEFRCSFRLSGMSLEKWSSEMNIEHKKLVGLYDYDKVIYQDSELNKNEEDYDKVDVIAMQECLDKQLSYYQDDMATIPYTKTGYIRRTLRRACKVDSNYRNKYFKNTRLDAELYQAMHEAYAGGYTHNNRFYIDKLVVAKIGHRDFKSHYPTQMAVNEFPLGRPEKIYDIDKSVNDLDIPEILDMSPKFSTLTVLRIYSARLRKNTISMPFLAEAKCLGKTTRDLPDNGRYIMVESEEGLRLTVTNYDLKILVEQYELEYAIEKVWRMVNMPLPNCLLYVVDKYFKGKSDKKNVVKNLTEQFGKLDPRTVDAQFELQQDKASLNSIYGCCATNPLRDTWEFDENMNFRRAVQVNNPETIEEALNKYYSKRNNFLPYQVGVWITAMARYELYEYINAIGYDKCLYCDTDSIFYIKDEETEAAISKLNAEKKAKAHYVVLDNGNKEYYDEFDAEPDCLAFKGLHSKCYGVVTEKGLEITIAGVPARTLIGMQDNKPVYLTREEELAGEEKDPIKALDHLTFGFTFYVNTGTTAVYIGALGADTWRKPTEIEIDGHKISTAGGCVIRKTPKKVIRDFTYDMEFEENIYQDMN